MAQKIDSEVLPVLRAMTITDADNVAILNSGQLDRPLYTKVNTVLVALGGKWNRKLGGHVFDVNPSELLADAVASGEYIDAKKQFQFYETPDEIANRMVKWAGNLNGKRVLEPSAGDGAIVRAIRRAAKPLCIDTAELNDLHNRKLVDAGVSMVAIGDFLRMHDQTFAHKFDAVIMNPPFTRSQDMYHVQHAYEFLRPGGVLLAIMSPGFTYRMDTKAGAFRSWFQQLDGRTTFNEPGAFKLSGTMVNTVIVQIGKQLE